MMNKKILTMLFGLLLAVGWTSSASAQRLPMKLVDAPRTMELNRENPRGTHSEAVPKWFSKGERLNAPKRSTQFNVTANVVHDKAWYASKAPVTWGSNSKLLTEPFTDPDGMIALLKRVYTDRTIPGIKFSAAWGCDVPYQTIQYGWNILGTNYNEDVKIIINSNIRLYTIEIRRPDGSIIKDWTAPQTSYSGSNFPSEWTTSRTLQRYTWENTAYTYYMNGGGTITIPASDLQNDGGYASIYIGAVSIATNPTEDNSWLQVGNDTFDYGTSVIQNDDIYYYHPMTVPGTITPPDENGYTVMLVKLYDGQNPNDLTHPTDSAPEYTHSEAELRSYFETYVKEIQLLTDGLRVGEGTDKAGTAFTYSGDLNRFYFISKGKMAYMSSLDILAFDLAPFYSMYEEFSPTTSAATQDEVTDFFDRMRQEETYPVKHDCQSVNYLQHYFSMSGKMGTNENPISNLVFYIPDNRGSSSTWRTYVANHQPNVGMYIIHLNAAVQAIPNDPDHYNVNVTWTSNLSHIAGDTDVPQIYYLFATYENGTTVLLTPDGTDDLSYLHNVDTGDPNGYPISYYVIGMPFVDNNNDGINDYTGTNVFDEIDTDFQAKSNTETVNIPGKNDFVNLERVRYESDYDVVDELNYYRNFFTVKNIPTTGTNGVTKDYVGTNGKSLVLLRGGDKVIYLDLKMEGDKCYYRFRYVDRTIEDGYNEDGNKNTNN